MEIFIIPSFVEYFMDPLEEKFGPITDEAFIKHRKMTAEEKVIWLEKIMEMKRNASEEEEIEIEKKVRKGEI